MTIAAKTEPDREHWMSKRRQNLAAKIIAIIEGLDDINVSDGAAWKAMAAELAKTLKTAPSKPPTARCTVRSTTSRCTCGPAFPAWGRRNYRHGGCQ